MGAVANKQGWAQIYEYERENRVRESGGWKDQWLMLIFDSCLIRKNGRMTITILSITYIGIPNKELPIDYMGIPNMSNFHSLLGHSHGTCVLIYITRIFDPCCTRVKESF
jgi:hypothetical protein